MQEASTPGQMTAISQIGIGTKHAEVAIISAKYALRKNVKLNHAGYPTLTGINTEGTDESLVLAIIRQESEFRIGAQSHAGAYGMMQLIAPTATRMSRKLKLRYSKQRLVTDPHYNIRLGSYYIGLLLDLYKGHHVPSIAAYNAGPANVSRWFKRSGDPRKQHQLDTIIDWVELIPFKETRNYVQRVLEAKNVYQVILKQEPLTLADDLLGRSNVQLSQND